MKKNYFENRTKGTRLVSFLLALSLIGSLFPMWTLAEGEQYGLKNLAAAIQKESTDTSGDGWENHAKSYALNQENGGKRFFIEYMNWRNTQPTTTAILETNIKNANEKITVGGIPRQTTFYVYAEEGEVICLGSSVNDSQLNVDHLYKGSDTKCDIVLTTPSGTAVAIDVEEDGENGESGKGHIKTRAQEKAGPKLNETDEGYTPITYVAPVTGIYSVVFHSKTGRVSGSALFVADVEAEAPFTSTQQYFVSAWDITVVSSDYKTVRPARTWAKYLSIANSTGNGVTSDLNTYVLTKDGYIYNVQFKQIDPAGFIFFSNNTGFTTTGDTPYSIYHSFYDRDNNLQYMQDEECVQLHHPDREDTETMITHRIFFEDPKNLKVADKSIKCDPEAPANIDNVTFEGATSGVFEHGQGGTFYFTSDKDTNAHIVIDFREQIKELDKLYGAELAYYYKDHRDRFEKLLSDYHLDEWNPDWHTEDTLPEDVTLPEPEWEEQSFLTEIEQIAYMHQELHKYMHPDTSEKQGSGIVELNGAAVQGQNTFFWEGNDTAGVPLPAGLFEGTHITVKTEARQGEIHFPMIDAESLGGIIIKRLNAAGTAYNEADADLVCFNNDPLIKGTIEPDGTRETTTTTVTISGKSCNLIYDNLTDGTKSCSGENTDIPNYNNNKQDQTHSDPQSTLQVNTDESEDEFGAVYEHVPIHSTNGRQGVMGFGNKSGQTFGDRAGIDIWAYYTNAADPHHSKHDFAVVRATSGSCKLSGVVFYDGSSATVKPDGVYDTKSSTSTDKPLRDVKVRLMKKAVALDENGKVLRDDSGNPKMIWAPMMHKATVPVIDPISGKFMKNKNGRVMYETKMVEYITTTDLSGKYTFSSVPDGTYAVQVLLNEVERDVRHYLPSTAKNGIYSGNRSNYKVGGSSQNADGNLVILSKKTVDGTEEVQAEYPTFDAGTLYYTFDTSVKVGATVSKADIITLPADGYTIFGASKQTYTDSTGTTKTFTVDNFQTQQVSADGRNGPKTATFGNIGYFTGVPTEYRKDYQVKKEWANRAEARDITVKLFVYTGDETTSRGMGHGDHSRTGNEVGSAKLTASGGWSYTWKDLDSRETYYFEEYYSKWDSEGHIIYETVFDEETQLDRIEERLVMVGCTMPVYADVDRAKAKNEETLYYKNLPSGETANQKYQDSKDFFKGKGIFTAFYGATNAHAYGAENVEPYVYHDAMTEHERQTTQDADALLYDMTYTLTTDVSGKTKILTLKNKQTYDERQYYVWLGHKTELPNFINMTTIVDGKETNHPVEMQLCVKKEHDHHENDQHIIGLTISSLDAAGTDFMEGNSTDKFHLEKSGDTSVTFTADKEIYTTGTGTRTYLCEYVIHVGGANDGKPASTKVFAEGADRVLVDLDTAVGTNDPDQVLYDDSEKIIGIVVDGKRYTAVQGNPDYRVYTWTLTIHVYDVKPDGIFEYDPTTNMVLQSAITEQASNAYQSWYTIKTDKDDDDAIRYYSDNPRAYGRIVDTKNPVTEVAEPIHHLIAVDEKGQNVLLSNKDRAGLFGRSIPVYSEDYQDQQKGKPIVDNDGVVYKPDENGVNNYDTLLENGVPITIADTKDTIRVPRYKHAVESQTSNTMSTCADLVGIAYSKDGVFENDADAAGLTYFDTYRNPNPVDSSSVEPGAGTESLSGATVNGKGGMLEARYAAGHTRGTETSNPRGQYQDHLNYVNVTFKPFGDLTETEDDTFYYKIVVFAEDFAEKEIQDYSTLDATQGVVMYTYFTMRPKEIDAAIAGATLSLGGDTIDLNYYVSGVTDDEDAAHQVDVKNYYMSFTSGGRDLLEDKRDTVGTIKDSGQTVSLQRFVPARNLVMDNTWDDTRTERLYAYTYTDLYAYQMSDPVTATLYYDSGDGFVEIGQQTYSVKEYAEDVLKAQTSWVEETTDSQGNTVPAHWGNGLYTDSVNRTYGEESSNQFQHSTVGQYLQHMLVDLLNYGAAAQAYEGSTTVAANELLVDELKNLNTRAGRLAGSLNDYKLTVTSNGEGAVEVLGAQLILSEGMTNDLRFTFTVKDESQKDYTLQISTDDESYRAQMDALRPDHLDTREGIIAKLELSACEEVKVDAETGAHTYRVTIEDIPPFYWGTAFTVEFLSGEVTVHAVSYSVNAYCNRMVNNPDGGQPAELEPTEENPDDLNALLLAMYNYGGSSRAWFLSEEDYKPVYDHLDNQVNGHDATSSKA